MSINNPELLHLLRVDIPSWRYGNGTNFTCVLFDLIAKADKVNKAKLTKVYPLEVKAVDTWRSLDIPEPFGHREYMDTLKEFLNDEAK